MKSKNKWIRMFYYIKPYTFLLFSSLVFALLVNGAELISPYITKIIIDDYIIGSKESINIFLLGSIYLFTVVLGAFFQFAQVYTLNLMGQNIIHNIRMELFSHIQYMPLTFFDNNSSGRILTRVTNDVEALNELYSGVLVALVKDIFMIIGIVIVMIKMDLELALVSFSILPIMIGITYFYNKKIKKNFMKIRNLIARINGFLAENISGMSLVQIFNREKEKFREFKDLNDKYNKASVFGVYLMAIFRPGVEFINTLAISILIFFCAKGVLNNTIEIGVLYAFITYVKKFFEPIRDLADKYSTIQSGSVSAERIFELLDNNHGLENMEKGISIKNIRGEIEFKNVWFSYNNKDWVLKNINFKVKPGETVAFVGATGSGKSTIINLIGRFYDIQKGEIFLDGINIKDINLKDLRKAIVVVMQDVFLFEGDIKYNIRLENKDISDEDVIKASRYVNASSFIEKLPNSYDEPVRERGRTLSAGQRQLLSFARAIAFNPSILVLDEATANIDTENEKIIQNSLEKISKERTTLIIAHRLSTIKNADKIIVLNKGEIKEVGNHEELLKKGGVYKKLYKLQYS
ncbi:ABC transporter ATP-binding protein [Defluviitalea phaphyphila]|uniref:ABC transporter ATP-binding protein n=1 Tax=Defluviitalea phaphyphila TaxID=1473580 RepID=UPI00073024CF|nr:ABC transporter ATP-binding protein [Defluviitalea phaphyphila]